MGKACSDARQKCPAFRELFFLSKKSFAQFRAQTLLGTKILGHLKYGLLITTTSLVGSPLASSNCFPSQSTKLKSCPELKCLIDRDSPPVSRCSHSFVAPTLVVKYCTPFPSGDFENGTGSEAISQREKQSEPGLERWLMATTP
jgi:hypothetical protein